MFYLGACLPPKIALAVRVKFYDNFYLCGAIFAEDKILKFSPFRRMFVGSKLKFSHPAVRKLKQGLRLRHQLAVIGG